MKSFGRGVLTVVLTLAMIPLLAILATSQPASAIDYNVGNGYGLVEANGTVRFYSPRGLDVHTRGTLRAPVVGSASTPDGRGMWIATSTGDVISFGAATTKGFIGDSPLNAPIVGIASTASGQGYWLVASDGGVFSFGDAQFHGSTGALRLNKPIVGISRTPSGNGYWMVASDGGIFSFGDAPFHGSTGDIRLNQPIVGMSPNSSGAGYWLVASDGGIFSFGGAQFFGSTGALTLQQPVVGMIVQPGLSGYWLVARDGGMFSFGAVPFHGSAGASGVRNITTSSWVNFSAAVSTNEQPVLAPVPVTPVITTTVPSNTGQECGSGYVNAGGIYVQSPCDSPSNATAICSDNTFSYSLNRQGTCSGHGGVQVWLDGSSSTPTTMNPTTTTTWSPVVQTPVPTSTTTTNQGPVTSSPTTTYTSPVPTQRATAICKDGRLSYSQTRSGTCSGHGGVAQWL